MPHSWIVVRESSESVVAGAWLWRRLGLSLGHCANGVVIVGKVPGGKASVALFAHTERVHFAIGRYTRRQYPRWQKPVFTSSEISQSDPPRSVGNFFRLKRNGVPFSSFGCMNNTPCFCTELSPVPLLIETKQLVFRYGGSFCGFYYKFQRTRD